MVKFPTLENRNPNFFIGLIIIKVNIEGLERIIEKFLKNYFTVTIILMATAVLKIGIFYFLSNAKHMPN